MLLSLERFPPKLAENAGIRGKPFCDILTETKTGSI